MIIIREEQKTEDKWDLSDLFPDLQEWQAALHENEDQIKDICKFQGKLGSKQVLLELLEVYFKLHEKLSKLYTYAHCLSDQDQTNTTNKKLLEAATSSWSSFSVEASYIAPELLSLPLEFQDEIIQLKEFSQYKIFLSEIFREREHILSDKEEALLSAAAEALSSSRDIFGQLNNADLNFGEIELGQERITLTHGNLITFLTKPQRDIRKKAYEQYLHTYKNHCYSLSAMYIGNLKKDSFYAKVRKFDSSRENSLFSDNISVKVYDQLIETLSSNLSPLHEYYGLRKQKLNLDSQYIYDTYVPLVKEVPLTFTYSEAVDAVCEACEPLGSEYADVLRKGLTTDRWVDKFENKGKRSGAYSSGCYKSKPYILMNYQTSGIDSLFTLAHEAGHSMHTYYSNRTQPYPTHSYTIFVAEVASTLNEILLNNYLIKKYSKSTEVQTYLINHLLDQIKATFFRQTMFAEFELLSHKLSDTNTPMSLDSLTTIHFELQQKYFGENVNIMELDSFECLRIPHFYSSFYVYKYATGMSAALSLSKAVLDSNDEAVAKYINFLSSGSSKFSLDLLREAGVDLETPKPILETVEYFEKNLNRLESLLR